MIRHLYKYHYKSEITADPKYETLVKNFLIEIRYNRKTVGKYNISNCDAKVESIFGEALSFKNHLITHHTADKKSFFANAVKIVYGQKLLNNYEIEEFAKCSFCQTPLPLEGLDSHPAKVLALKQTLDRTY